MIILHFHLQPQFKNELFHIYFTLLSLIQLIKESKEVIHYWLKLLHTKVVIATDNMTNSRPLPVQ